MINAEITVKFTINNVCSQREIDRFGYDTQSDSLKFANLVRNMILDESLMGVIDYRSQRIIEVKKVVK